MARVVYAFVALVFPFIIEIDIFIEELLELSAVLIDSVDSHYLTHVSLARRVTDLAGTAAKQEHRSVSVLLHIHHGDHRNEMSDMQAVSSRVEADVEFDLLLAEQFSELLRIGALRHKTSFYEHIIDVRVLAYIVRNK